MKKLFINNTLKKPLWWITMIITSFIMFLVVGVLQNLQKIQLYFLFDNPLGKKIITLFKFGLALRTTYTTAGLIMAIVLSLLFGLNIALFVCYIKMKKTGSARINTGMGAFGMVAGIFGVGCAACGAALIGPLLAFLGIGGILTVLPFHGQEFALLGIVLLLISVISLTRNMMKPQVCEIEI